MSRPGNQTPRWQRIVLTVASAQCLFWGLFILLFPERSAAVYGFGQVPAEIFLWRGTGLIIFLFGVGYGIASTNPVQHWAVILIGMLAKVLGPLGMLATVIQGDVSARVMYLIPLNDLIWWMPFAIILRDSLRTRTSEG